MQSLQKELIFIKRQSEKHLEENERLKAQLAYQNKRVREKERDHEEVLRMKDLMIQQLSNQVEETKDQPCGTDNGIYELPDTFEEMLASAAEENERLREQLEQS